MHKAKEGLNSAAALPVALWAEILQHVPQKQRLIQCALVCTTCARAAAQATVHLVHTVKNSRAIKALQSWIALQAGQLLTINIRMQWHHPKPMLRLPLDQLSQLQHLQLKYFRLQLPGEEDSQGSSHAATGMLSNLQQLELEGVELASISSLLQVTHAPQLRGLIMIDIALKQPAFTSMSKIWWSYGAEPVVKEVADAMPGMLQQLPQLSVLKVPWFPLSDAAMQHVGALQGLQAISFARTSQAPSYNLQHLPSSITRMELKRSRLPSELPQLSGLLQLELGGCSVSASVLSSLTQLQVLHMMEDCTMLPDTIEEYNTEGTAALLDALLQLKQLQDLKLKVVNLDIASIAPARFAALTASTHLTQLSLTAENDQSLPQGAVQHMFPVGRLMPSLQRLSINSKANYNRHWCLTSADLGHISQSCPQLKCLEICGSVQPGADLSVLLQLPHSCTSLIVGGVAFEDAAAPAAVQLTQLQHLSWESALEFTDKGLEQLVALELDSLHAEYCGLSKELQPDRYDSLLELQSSPELGSVSQQLDTWCDRSPVLAASRFPKFRKKTAAERRVLQQLRLEVDRLRVQLESSQAEVERLNQQLSGQQQ